MSVSSSAHCHCRPITLCRLIAGLVLPLTGLFLGACSSGGGFLKAKPARPAGFLAHPKEMNEHPAETPFHYAAHSKSVEAHQRAAAKTQLYVAPVETSQLRRIQKTLTRATYRMTRRERPVDELANQLRIEFAQAFVESPLRRYRVVARPSEKTLSLELALVELDPTSVTGNTARTLGNYFLTPLVGLASYGRTAGSIAIEGRLVNSETEEVVFQFADRESDQFTVFSVKNYQAYGFIDSIIETWARQFEEFTRTPINRELDDTSGFTLNPF
jgi:hypothetical protein